MPAKEIVVLHDPEAEKSLVIVFFETEDDYQRGDEALSAMPADDTPRQAHVSREIPGRVPYDGLAPPIADVKRAFFGTADRVQWRPGTVGDWVFGAARSERLSCRGAFA